MNDNEYLMGWPRAAVEGLGDEERREWIKGHILGELRSSHLDAWNEWYKRGKGGKYVKYAGKLTKEEAIANWLTPEMESCLWPHDSMPYGHICPQCHWRNKE